MKKEKQNKEIIEESFTKTGFTVVMKDYTPSEEASKLMEQILKNKYVEQLEGTIVLGLKDDKQKTKS